MCSIESVRFFSPLLFEDRFVPLEGSSVSLGNGPELVADVATGVNRAQWVQCGGLIPRFPLCWFPGRARKWGAVSLCWPFLEWNPFPHFHVALPQSHAIFVKYTSDSRKAAATGGCQLLFWVARSLPITPNPIHSHFQTCSGLALSCQQSFSVTVSRGAFSLWKCARVVLV